MITLRRFSFLKDIRALMALERDTFGTDAFPTMEFFYLQNIGGDTFLLAYIEHNLAGYVSAFIDNDKGYIASLAVDSQYRGRGIAKILMNEVISHMVSKMTISSIELHVRKSNEGAIALYKNMNFEVVATEEDYYPDEDAFVMCLYV